MITKNEALNIIAAKHGLSSWMYASMIKETIELEEIIYAAMELYAEQSNSHKHAIVRGGDIEAQSVPLEGEALKWTNSAVTQITPTEPLPAEEVAQNGRVGIWDIYKPGYERYGG